MSGSRLYMPIRGTQRRGFAWNARNLVRLGREIERIGIPEIRWTARGVNNRPGQPGERHEVVELIFADETEAAAFRTASSLFFMVSFDDAKRWLDSESGKPF